MSINNEGLGDRGGGSSRSGVLQIDDDSGPSLVPSMAASISDAEVRTREKGSVEQIHDATGPAHHNIMLTGEDLDQKKPPPSYGRAREKGMVEQIHDAGPARPGQEDLDLKKKPPPSYGQGAFHEDSSRQQDGEEEGLRRDTVSIPRNDDAEEPLSTLRTPADVFYRDRNRRAPAATQNPQASSSGLERDSSVPIIPEAFLVEDDPGDVVISGYAEPMPAWYKQKRAQQLIALVVFVLVAASIAVGVSVGVRPDPPDPLTAALEPTSSPTSCSYRISKSMQRLNNLPVDGPGYSAIAADADNMVLVTRDIESTESIYLVFYQWNHADGRWQLRNFIIEQTDETGLPFSADISSDKSLVGFPGAGSKKGAVYAYKQNDLGFWGKEASSLLPDDRESNFGDAINVDGDLACISAERDGGGYVSLFRLEEDEWIRVDEIGPFSDAFVETCLVEGDIIAVKIHTGAQTANTGARLHLFRFDATSNTAQPLQEPLTVENTELNRIGATSLSGNHLLHSLERFDLTNGWKSEEILAYHRQGSGPFALAQQLNASDFDDDFGRAFDHTGDLLVISGSNTTYAFAKQSGGWELQEETVLDQGYTSYQVTGRSIIAMAQRSELAFGVEEGCIRLKGCFQSMTFELVAFDVEGCIQPMPTQTPSMSVAPSPLLTHSPSTIASSQPSLSPTASSAPTEMCWWVELSIVFDPYPDEFSWEIQKSIDNSSVVARSDFSSDTDPVEERYCLPASTYRLIVRDSGADGICCMYGAGTYRLTSEGVVLVEGGEFESDESTAFSIPVAKSTASLPASATAVTPGMDACSGYTKKQCIKDTANNCSYDDERELCYTVG